MSEEVVSIDENCLNEELTSHVEPEPQSRELIDPSMHKKSAKNIADSTPSRYKQSGAANRRSEATKNNSTSQTARKNSNRPRVIHRDPAGKATAQEQVEAAR